MSEFDLERYLTIRRAYGASLGAPSDLAFLLDTTGVPQVWTLADPGGWPVQRTFDGEPVSFVDASPSRPEHVFGRDEGGNERVQFYRLDAEGGVLNLTGHPAAKHRWGGWSSDGDRVAFTANRRDTAVFDVYVQGRDERGAEAQRVHEGDGWFTVAGWSPSDDRLAVVEAHSSVDQDVYVLDLESGEFRHLTPGDATVRYGGLEWGPDGEGLYVTTDRGADTRYLARLDASTGDLTTVWAGGDWPVDGVVVHPDSGRLVASRNVEGYTELVLGDIVASGAVEFRPMPAIPGGVAGGVSFAPSGDRFALTVSGRAQNPNVHVVDVDALPARDTPPDGPVSGGPAVAADVVDRNGDSDGSAAVAQWTRASTAGIPPAAFVEPALVRYESFDGRDIPAFVSVPDGAQADTTPVIVDVHGGPESQRRPGFAGLTQYFLSRGYAVFEPNVRGSTGYGRAYTHLDDVEKRPDAVRDLAAAHDWLTDHALVDSDRIAIKGGSYGGFMVLAAMTTFPDRWAAGVDVVGIANFVTFLENTGAWRRSLREAEYGSLESDRDFLESISPLSDIESIDAPLFVLHGANDPRVPVGEAEQVASAAREQGVPVELLVFDDEGHGITKLDNRITAYTRIASFLDEHV